MEQASCEQTGGAMETKGIGALCSLGLSQTTHKEDVRAQKFALAFSCTTLRVSIR